MEQYFIGVDIGGTNIKAVVFSENGNELGKLNCQTPLDIVQEGYHQRDMLLMWSETAKAIRGAIQNSGISAAEIAAVGCTGHGKGLYLWGKDNKPCYPGIASTDQRASEIVDKWITDGTVERARKINMQSTLACQPVSLLAWLKQKEPSVYADIQWVFEAKDYIRFMLTGRAMAEYTDYSGTSLMNLHTKSFDAELLEIYGIPEIMPCLPPLCKADEICGFVTKEASDQTGLPEGIPVCGGMFDIDACAVSMNISDPAPICVITGTWSINEYISKTPVAPEQSVNHSVFCDPQYYLIEESSPTSAGNLEWVLETLFGTEKQDYADIDNKIDSIDLEDSAVLFFPFLYGSNAPGMKNAAFWGLHSGYTRAHILRAVYEGVVFSHKQHIDRLLAHRDLPPYIRVAGGAANSDVWMQMFSDALNMTVEVVEGKELGALGAAMAAAVSMNVYTDYTDAADKMVRIRKIFQPQPEKYVKYLEKYKQYSMLLKQLSEN